MNLNNWAIITLNSGCTVLSSGTTGPRKKVYQPQHKLKEMCKVANEVQAITQDSRILTVCKMDHAGGALAQTLPALSIGAYVNVQQFNPYTFENDVKDYTHTHLTPGHIELLSKTKGFNDARYDGLWVTCGSDRVHWWMIEYFVERGATFTCNWGMSEIGPVAINSTFNNLEKINMYRDLTPDGTTIMGDESQISLDIDKDGELIVWGNLCVVDDILKTGDIVEYKNGIWFYKGRK